jgi:hypothetical protein
MGKTSNHIQRNGKLFTGDLFSGKTTNRLLESVDPPLPEINFDITALSWSAISVTDEESFVEAIEFMGFENVVVSNFTFVSNRISCFLSFSTEVLGIFGANCEITELHNLTALIPTNILSISFNNLTNDLSAITPLVNLVQLDLDENPITETGWESLSNWADNVVENGQLYYSEPSTLLTTSTASKLILKNWSLIPF